MTEASTAKKKQLMLDTDWLSAVGMVLWFLICSMFLTGAAIKIAHGHWRPSSVSWHTWLALGACGWLFFQVKERHIRLVSIVFAVGPVSRILLKAFHANIDTQLANSAFLQVIELMLYIGGCGYAVWWFQSKIKHV
jgi:hypothetical protein